MVNKKHKIWVELYRPDTLETYIGNKEFKEYVSRCIEKNDIQHLIFHGKTGTGKTTAARIIINNLDCDHLYLNGSDENGIDTVRDKIKNFASTASFKPLKIVVLDDCQNFTPQAQQALLNIIETYSMSTRFIFTCNALGKLIPAIQSRCHVQEIVPISKKDVAMWIWAILEKEHITADPETLKIILDRYFPDIRRCINACQALSSTGTLRVPDKKFSVDYVDEVIIIFMSNSKDRWGEIRQIIADNNVTDFSEIYRSMYDNIYHLNSSFMETCIFINEAQVESVTAPDREITFMSCISKILSLK